MPTKEDFLSVESKLLSSVQAKSYAGYDPFDGLNSRLFKALKLDKVALFRLIWIQVFKRSPINLRSLTLVPRARNPKGIGLFISGLLKDYQRTGDTGYLIEAEQLGHWLVKESNSRHVWGGASWGYHFPWQAKAFYVPKGKPNVITTLYVARALYELAQFSADKLFYEYAVSSANFIETSLLNTDEQGKPYIAYIPGETAFVHNASLWGAAWLVKIGAETNNAAMVEKAVQVIDRSVEQQQPDGAWRYGSMPHHSFIDGFHTGYNLEAIHMAADVLKTDKYDACIIKGLAYYRDNFFLNDGTPKYYNTNVYPIDVHSAAQAVITLTTVSSTVEDKALAEKVLQWSVDNLYSQRKQRFVYQKHRWLTNKVDYVRWTQGWAYLMLAHFNYLSSNDSQ